MNAVSGLLAVGWTLSTFAAGLMSLDLTPLGVNPAVVALIGLGLNAIGGGLYVFVGRTPSGGANGAG